MLVERGKAPDIEGLTAEHLQYCHPSVVVLLAKLFQRIMTSGCVPTGFKYSYIVPIPKVKDGRSKAMKCDDFRGRAISPCSQVDGCVDERYCRQIRREFSTLLHIQCMCILEPLYA